MRERARGGGNEPRACSIVKWVLYRTTEPLGSNPASNEYMNLKTSHAGPTTTTPFRDRGNPARITRRRRPPQRRIPPPAHPRCSKPALVVTVQHVDRQADRVVPLLSRKRPSRGAIRCGRPPGTTHKHTNLDARLRLVLGEAVLLRSSLPVQHDQTLEAPPALTSGRDSVCRGHLVSEMDTSQRVYGITRWSQR